MQQLTLGRTDMRRLEARAGRRRGRRCAAASLELPRVRAMMKARDDVAKRARRCGRHGARQHQADPAARAGPDRSAARWATLNGRLELAGERIASADLTIGAGKGSTFRVTPAGSGRKLFLYVADFGQMLKDAGWLDGLVGGYLHIDGRYDDAVRRLAARPASSRWDPTGCRR